MVRPTFGWRLLHPVYWITWFGFGLWYLLAQLPYRWQVGLGRRLGRLVLSLARSRREIARCNLALCFPEKSAQERQAMLVGLAEALGVAFFETGMAWFWSARRLDAIYTVKGLEHLQQAQAVGQGVILMAFHFTHIDIGAKLLSRSVSIDGLYRPHKNAVYDYVQFAGRHRHTSQGHAIPRNDMRAMTKALRRGRAIWYAPDQDYGPKHSVFAPFFGVPAATITATSQLAKLGRATVIPFTQMRNPDGSGYTLQVYPPWEDFPGADELVDANRINRFVEARILEQPAHYLWVHRRFKTRPPGEPDVYQQWRAEQQKKP